MNRAHPPRLVLVTNRRSARFSIPELAVQALAGGVDLIQIREKDLTEIELMRLCRDVLERGISPSRIMVNGSPAVARELGIGLHLPESFESLTSHHAADYSRVSRSVHSDESAAASGWADFVIAGHVFTTSSKPGLPPISIPGLGSIVQRSPAPVIAIGGITPENVAEVVSSGASGAAVLSAINDAVNPESAAHSFRKVLEQHMAEQTAAIDITVNGKPVSVTPGLYVLDYLAQRGLHERMVVVELNGEILKKAAFGESLISAGDKIEIVHFVGGG